MSGAVEWYRVEAPYFCAGLRLEGGQIVGTPPVLDWILVRRDRSLTWLLDYAKRRRWKVERLLPAR